MSLNKEGEATLEEIKRYFENGNDKLHMCLCPLCEILRIKIKKLIKEIEAKNGKR